MSDSGCWCSGFKQSVIIFIILSFSFSSVFWYLIATTKVCPESRGLLTFYYIAAMWCPAIAAIITALIVKKPFSEFGFQWKSTKWQIFSMLLPVAAGLFMFGTAWITGIAPFNFQNAESIFSISFLPALLFMLAFNCFAAFGEELGWRGFLVPELSKTMDFTHLALVSAAIWTVWHFPLIIFSNYHGTGPLWYSLLVFIPSVMGAGVILAFMRLASGSVWVAVFFHGFWNYFIQNFYPNLTVTTDAGQMMLGEFGWFSPALYVVLAAIFWSQRKKLPKTNKIKE